MTLFDFRFSSFQFAVLNAQGCELRDDIDGPLCVEDIFQCFMNKKNSKIQILQNSWHFGAKALDKFLKFITKIF